LADDSVIIVVLFLGFLAFLVWMHKQPPTSIDLAEVEKVREYRGKR
jgi:hypothetical protein